MTHCRRVWLMILRKAENSSSHRYITPSTLSCNSDPHKNIECTVIHFMIFQQAISIKCIMNNHASTSLCSSQSYHKFIQAILYVIISHDRQNHRCFHHTLFLGKVVFTTAQQSTKLLLHKHYQNHHSYSDKHC